MDISDRVRALCETKGISFRKLEQALGIGNGTIHRWGQVMPSALALQDVAQYFGVTVGYLLGNSDEVVAGVPALHIRGTKSKNADRDIPLPSNLSRLIQKSLKSPNRASQGYLCKLCADTFGKRWRQLKEEIHGGDDLVPYCLRHTYCTDLQHKNVDIRVAQKLMGHSTIDLTSTIYSHLDEDLFTITYEMLEEPHWKCGKAKAPRVRVPCPLPE